MRNHKENNEVDYTFINILSKLLINLCETLSTLYHYKLFQ